MDLTPADNRPYIGSSSGNSEIDLIFEYNGLNRLLGGFGPFGDRNFNRNASSLNPFPDGAGSPGPHSKPAANGEWRLRKVPTCLIENNYDVPRPTPFTTTAEGPVVLAEIAIRGDGWCRLQPEC